MIEDKTIKLARGLGIPDYKSDLELEKEVRIYMIYAMRLIEETGDIFSFESSKADDHYRLFNSVQMRRPGLHLPKLTLKVIQLKDKLSIENGLGIIYKIIGNPDLYSESLKYINKEMYGIPRAELVDKFHYDLDTRIPYHRLDPLIWYQNCGRAKSIFKSVMTHFPGYFAALYVYMKILETVFELTDAKRYGNLLLVLFAYIYTFVQCYRAIERRYEQYLD